MTAAREQLPQRRMHRIFDFVHDNMLYTVGLGAFADGRPAEVFLNVAKSGTPLETYARDSAILLSLLLQHGCPITTVRHAISRNADGSASGPIGALLDLLEGGTP
jgi:hypothetical protein